MLPTELWLLVFEQVILDVQRASPRLVRSLVTLTSIQSSWRHIIIDSPRFWTHISVKIPDLRKDKHHSNERTQILSSDFERVSTFLNRSRHLLIDLYISRRWMAWHTYSEKRRRQADESLQWPSMHSLLAPHMPRCYSISIYTEGIVLGAEPMAQIHLSDLPFLQEFTYVSLSHWYEVPAQPLASEEHWTFSPPKASLRTLKFSHSHHYLPKALDVHWPSLRILDLDISGDYIPKVCDTLSQLPTLRELHLRIRYHPQGLQDAAPRPQRVYLPLLEKISTTHAEIWEFISTPILSHAAIDYGTSKYWRNRYSLFLLQVLAEMPIRHLLFSYSLVPPFIALPMLRSLADVEIFELHNCFGCERVLEPLLLQREERALLHCDQRNKLTTILPSLKSLTITLFSTPYLSTAHNTPMMENIVHRLRRTSIEVVYTLDGYHL
ncbi:hypothetical protein DL93DRAFT_1097481 [Clavulina sp. PMI_390]|nr:hypothetical protein DL93DRAFT_1097481 [Clavulina sp. PMI_390]